MPKLRKQERKHGDKETSKIVCYKNNTGLRGITKSILQTKKPEFQKLCAKFCYTI